MRILIQDQSCSVVLVSQHSVMFVSRVMFVSCIVRLSLFHSTEHVLLCVMFVSCSVQNVFPYTGSEIMHLLQFLLLLFNIYPRCGCCVRAVKLCLYLT